MGQRGCFKSRGLYFFPWKRNRNHQLGTGCCIHYRIVSAAVRVLFVHDWMPYIILRGGWCNAIVLNVRAQDEEKEFL